MNQRGYTLILLPLVLGSLAMGLLHSLSSSIVESVKVEKIYETKFHADELKKMVHYLLSNKQNCSLNFNGKVLSLSNKLQMTKITQLEYYPDPSNTALKKKIYNSGDLYKSFVVKEFMLSREKEPIQPGSTGYLGEFYTVIEQGHRLFSVRSPAYIRVNKSNENQVEECFLTTRNEQEQTVEDVICEVENNAPAMAMAFDPGDPKLCFTK